MAEKEKIPCRVCGKLFEPCVSCQTHDDMFRWRNFACSRECAAKYINDTIAYRESLKNNKEQKNETEMKSNDELVEKDTTTRKRVTKKISTDIAENEKTE